MHTTAAVLLLTAAGGAALAGMPEAASLHGHLGLREVVGLVSFGALGGMLVWHLRK